VDGDIALENEAQLRAFYDKHAAGWAHRGDGLNEGRRSAADFDIHAYLHRYPDLIAAFGDTNHGAALFHWLTYGAGEGRNAAP
jgi:hypothetical protein